MIYVCMLCIMYNSSHCVVSSSFSFGDVLYHCIHVMSFVPHMPYIHMNMCSV